VRILFEQEHWNVAQCAQALSLACTNPVDPLATAAWLEGFLRGSGLLLIVNDPLWHILNDWVRALPEAAFIELLPLLRRTFSSFEKAERRQLGERVAHGSVALGRPETAADLDPARAAQMLPILTLLLAEASA